MDDWDEQNKQELISLLREKRVLLLVGAGSSAFVNYPTWKQLLSRLAGEFAPGLLPRVADGNNTVLAGAIKSQVERDHRLRDYHTFLVQEFKPKPIAHTRFHEDLVRLGFCGVATFNYDAVLESAIVTCANMMCEPIDLCSTDTCCRVFDYLRDLKSDSCMRHVLHLHGFYLNPKQIILTRADYNLAYGEMISRTAAPDSAANKQYDPAIASLFGRPLDSLHRKVIWALLAIHPVLFVGFGVKDEFFLDTLDIVRQDFNLHRETAHFALMDYADVSAADGTTDKRDKEERLNCLGIKPIFYHVPASKDHSGLQHLVSELANAVGVPLRPSPEELGDRMWRRVNENPTR